MLFNVYVKRGLIAIFTVATTYLSMHTLVSRLEVTYVASDSIHPTFLIKDNGRLEAGKYMTFNILPYLKNIVGLNPIKIKGLMSGNRQELLASKRIACAPGDKLEARHEERKIQWYCNNQPIASQSYHHSLLKMEPASYQLKENTVFVVGDNEDSVDSRYFGVVDLKKGYRLQRPLTNLFKF
jgi:type IV secretory pathway protease TraF